MKTLLFIVSLGLLSQVQAGIDVKTSLENGIDHFHRIQSLQNESREDDCIKCVKDISDAVDVCSGEEVNVLQCIETVIGTTSDCIRVICDVLDIIQGGIGECNPLGHVKSSEVLRDPELLELAHEFSDLRSISLRDDDGPRDCLDCVQNIVIAIEDCNDNTTSTLQCVKDSLGAASDCIHFICDVIDIIGGGDGSCANDNEPVGPIIDCATCVGDVGSAVDACSDLETVTLECIEAALDAASDCIVCVCDVVGTIGGVPIDGC